jgi:REP element-mobilizing transposase RayT
VRNSRKGVSRFEHWYRDNTVYFVTARCRDRFRAFASEEAKQIFWDRFDHYTQQFGFEPWFASLMDNHYHFGGHLLIGKNLGVMMQRIHGSVAKLVNDILPECRVPFWREQGRQNDYYDGCFRDPLQCRRACRYTLKQAGGRAS